MNFDHDLKNSKFSGQVRSVDKSEENIEGGIVKPKFY